MIYWIDEGWYVGKLKELPNVMSQGKTLDDLEANIHDAYKMMMNEDNTSLQEDHFEKIIGLEM